MNASEGSSPSSASSVPCCVLLAIPFGLEAFVRSEQSDNDDLRQALSDVQDARNRVRERQAKKDAIVQRYAKTAPPLAGYLEQTARQQKLEVTDSTPLPDVPHGKRYMEHGTDIHLKKTGMLPLALFLESLERSGYPVAATRLNIRKRSGENDSYDVEVGVSSYDRIEPPAATPPAGVPRRERATPQASRTDRGRSRPLHRLPGDLRGAHLPVSKAQRAHRGRLQRRPARRRWAQELQIDDLSGYWLSGVRMSGVTLLTASPEAGKTPTKIEIDEATARYSLLALLVGYSDINFDAFAFGGEASGSYDVGGKDRSVDVTLDSIDVGQAPAARRSFGRPARRQARRRGALDDARRKGVQGNGSVSLEIQDASVGDGKAKIKGALALPKIDVGTLTFAADAKDGVLKITKLVAGGKDLEVQGDGRITMRELATDSLLDLQVRFRINDAYRAKSDITKSLFGAPGSNAPALFEMADPERSGSPSGRTGSTVGPSGGRSVARTSPRRGWSVRRGSP